MVNFQDPAKPQLTDSLESQKEQVGSVPQAQESDHVHAPLHAVEVIEVDDDAAWALWEDSVAFQNSQFSSDAMFHSTVPMPLSPPNATTEFADPFALVHKKSR